MIPVNLCERCGAPTAYRFCTLCDGEANLVKRVEHKPTLDFETAFGGKKESGCSCPVVGGIKFHIGDCSR